MIRWMFLMALALSMPVFAAAEAKVEAKPEVKAEAEAKPAVAEPAPAAEPEQEKSAMLQLQAYPGVAIFPEDTAIYGVNLALVGSSRYVEGVSFHIGQESGEFYGVQLGGISLADVSGGLQLSFFNSAAANEGLQLGVVNVAGRQALSENRKDSCGIQVGGYNYADKGFQLGLINYNANSPLPWTLLVNWSF